MQISLKTTKPGGASQGHHVLSILGHLMSPPKTPTSELWSMELRHHNPTHGPWPNKPLSIALGPRFLSQKASFVFQIRPQHIWTIYTIYHLQNEYSFSTCPWYTHDGPDSWTWYR